MNCITSNYFKEYKSKNFLLIGFSPQQHLSKKNVHQVKTGHAVIASTLHWGSCVILLGLAGLQALKSPSMRKRKTFGFKKENSLPKDCNPYNQEMGGTESEKTS